MEQQPINVDPQLYGAQLEIELADLAVERARLRATVAHQQLQLSELSMQLADEDDSPIEAVTDDT